MEHLWLLSLRIVHIGAGLFWVGAVVITGLFIYPATRAAGASGQQVLVEIMLKRKLAMTLPISAVLTTLAGLTLFYHNQALSNDLWARSPMGKGMSFGAAAAVLAAIIGIGVASPMARKLAAASMPGAAVALSPEQRGALQKRAAMASQATMVLVVIATIAMAVARYL